MKIVRVATMPLSLDIFCKGFLGQMAEKYEVMAIASPGPELVRIGEREGVATAAVPMTRGFSPLADLKALRHLTEIFRRERPDMVHSITPKAGLLAMTAAHRAGVPARVHTFTGLLFPSASWPMKAAYTAWDKTICRLATHVIAEGHGVKRDLERANVTGKPVTVLGYGNVRGVDLEYYCSSEAIRVQAQRNRERLGIPQEAFTFVYVGRITPDKGVAELVEAFEQLSREMPARLLLVGSTLPTDEPLRKETIETIDNNDSIIKIAWNNDPRPYYVMADAHVLPSYREGFPNVVLEAGAMGLPSIVTDINGSREIIAEGLNGWVAKPRSSQSLLEAMRMAASDPARCKRMGEAARENVARKYEQTYVRACQMDYYDAVFSEIKA